MTHGYRSSPRTRAHACSSMPTWTPPICRRCGTSPGQSPVGVRVRSARSCRSLRARLRACGLPPIVIDTGAVLDEGDAHDVSAVLDAVRLARTAARMRACGFAVLAIVCRGPYRPSTIGFAALRPEELLAFTPSASETRSGSPSLGTRLDATTGSQTIAGNRIEVELDNSKARRWLLQAIEHSQRCVHFQVYMALDDDVGRPVEAALAAAAARGVTVRVLVDSLHGLHGSFGLRNPILERLSTRPGVELRLGKPITPRLVARGPENSATTASSSWWTTRSRCSADGTCRTSTTPDSRR